MPPAVADLIGASASEYRRCQRIVGAPRYPRDNRCHRCDTISGRPLIPWPAGWRCEECTYLSRRAAA